jgi:hypothetical protein
MNLLTTLPILVKELYYTEPRFKPTFRLVGKPSTAMHMVNMSGIAPVSPTDALAKAG